MLIAVTITDIWTKFDIELNHHTINIRNVPNLHDLKIQDGSGRHLGFRNMSITRNCIELFAQNLMGRCITAMRRWHSTITQNGEFIRVASLNECREHRCDDVNAYKSSHLNYRSLRRNHLFEVLSGLLIRILPTNFIKTAKLYRKTAHSLSKVV